MGHDTDRFFGIESLWHDLRSGRAGFGIRMILSVAAIGACISIIMVILGLLDNNFRVRDEHAFAGFAAAAAAWLACLYAIWSTFPRWRRALRTGFICVGIGMATICICILFGTMLRRPEFLIAATIFGGISSIITIFGAVAYQTSKGRKVIDSEGKVHVTCPGCGYSMAGLDSCACPECGNRYALDELIRLQGYEALSQLARVPAAQPAPTAHPERHMQQPPLLGPATI